MSVETWKSVADWATIVLIALTVVSGSVALILGDRINEKQAEQLRKFSGDLSIQQQRAAEAEKQLLEVRKKQQPRGVPIDIILSTKDAPHQRLIVEYQDGPPEVKLFADLLCETLVQAKWEISGPKPIPSVAAKGAGNSEITILWPDEGGNPGSVSFRTNNVLLHTFIKAGWSVSGALNKDVARGTLLVLIGPR
jgi:hypothetical protein